MRSYKVYALGSDGVEVYQDTVHSAAEGQALHAQLRSLGWKFIRVYDCLGGLQFEADLSQGRVTRSARNPREKIIH